MHISRFTVDSALIASDMLVGFAITIALHMHSYLRSGKAAVEERDVRQYSSIWP